LAVIVFAATARAEVAPPKATKAGAGVEATFDKYLFGSDLNFSAHPAQQKK
jgi:hypothetical protein